MSRCWAHNQAHIRCELDAGHNDEHTVYIQWSDDECYDPAATAITEIKKLAAPPPMPEPVAAEVTGACIACSHRHKGGECKCGCYEYIG
jgi:hypothetical protein